MVSRWLDNIKCLVEFLKYITPETMMDMKNDPRALAVAYIEAVGQKQFDRVAELLHPNVEFLTSGRSSPARADYRTERRTDNDRGRQRCRGAL